MSLQIFDSDQGHKYIFFTIFEAKFEVREVFEAKQKKSLKSRIFKYSALNFTYYVVCLARRGGGLKVYLYLMRVN